MPFPHLTIIKVDTSEILMASILLLSKVKEEIAGALKKIIVSSIATCEVSEDWRVANCARLFKKGSR